MFKIKRRTKDFLSGLCLMSLFVYTCGAETMATYSGQYTADLEQKQVLLQSISEDLIKSDSRTEAAVDELKASENKKMSKLHSDMITLAEIVPPTGKINMAFISMSGTLSPKSACDKILRYRDNTRE